MTQFPYVEAEYEDGYVHREDEQDHSPFVQWKNIFDDILHKRPEAAHGKMVRFTLCIPDGTVLASVDWTTVPDNARPIRFKHLEGRFFTQEEIDNGTPSALRLTGIDFGYQYTDEQGKNQQEVIKV